jgi:hypothetical protein
VQGIPSPILAGLSVYIAVGVMGEFSGILHLHRLG